MALDSDRIRKPARKIRKILKNISREPTLEEVHDLRTNIRRVEAEFSALALDGNARQRRLLKNLARIRKRAGKVRDMDVLIGYASGVHPDGESDCSVQLLEYLGAERRKNAKRLHGTVTKSRSKTRDLLKRTAADLDDYISSGTGGLGASAQAAASALTLESELSKVTRLTRQNLHPYRLKVKELRNVLRMSNTASKADFVSTLGAVKDSIGEWHDWQELVAIGEEVLNHGAKCKLIAELKKITETKFDRALAQAEQMRAKYLGISGKKKRPPAEEVWRATAAIPA